MTQHTTTSRSVTSRSVTTRSVANPAGWSESSPVLPEGDRLMAGARPSRRAAVRDERRPAGAVRPAGRPLNLVPRGGLPVTSVGRGRGVARACATGEMRRRVPSVRAVLPARRRATVSAPRHAERLTVRGRRLMVLTIVLLGVVGGLMLLGGPSAAGQSTTVVVQPVVSVQPGQSLWQLAVQVAPGVDPRATIAQIRELNGLSSSTVLPGQQLKIPAVR